MNDVREYHAALGVYVRESEGEKIDTRDHTATQLADTDVEILLLMERGDLAAILSNGLDRVESAILLKVRRLIGKPTKLQQTLKDLEFGDLIVWKDRHPACLIYQKLLRSPEGATCIVKLAEIYSQVLTNAPTPPPEESELDSELHNDDEQGSLFDRRDAHES